MPIALRRISMLVAALLIALGADAPDTATPPAEAPATAPAPTPAANPPTSSLIAGGGNVAVIRIDGMIYDFTLDSLRRRVDRALAGGATIIVIELDTPGGLVTSALDIAKYIKADIPVPTVAWINNQAYSAGILIASACDQIVMSPSSTTGDCAPIVPGTELSPTERAKALSPILEEFRDNAASNGYHYAMFHAMCVLGVEVYQIQHVDTGEIKLVNQADYRIMVEGQAMPTASAAVPASQPSEGVSIDVATAGDIGKWKLVRQVHDGRTLLTVSQDRAVDMGLAKSKTVRSKEDVNKFLSGNTVYEVPQTWSENIAGWLTSLPVRAVLILALALGAYIEMQSPGLGLPGAIALLALILLLGAPFLVGLAEVWHILLFFLGFILLMVELFVTPGFGIIGFTGIGCMFIGLVLMVVPTGGTGPINLPPPEMINRLNWSVVWTLIASVLSIVGFFFITRFFGSIPLLNRLILANPQPHLVGMPDRVTLEPLVAIGAAGRTVTELRPAGRAEIQGQIVDVMSLGSFIESNQKVRVVELQGNIIVVDRAP